MAFSGRAHGAAKALGRIPALCVQKRDSSTIFVGGLSWGLTEGIVQEAFSSFGEVREVRIVKDRETGKSKGYGFITYVSEAKKKEKKKKR
ncbi:glycine-rich RNA-binding protein 4, mitochondrial-like [Selaginella moellendorffii]|uniref:glycine-rich RNA-binding protein 4, mitochondrial-like n=1 Tax=Selaginella moellendorffii TaxID=88036 RepID=UPI000D1CF5EC|nr:glycine-rich RNA-binding protein 4, mitochondrial-like [Selaginella moellendorffii]|eukprot:XP_024516367.1 glycine-rich RNA-binding protein 4, mitochondrial-like [Selaginella moellendorffii]